MSTPQRQKNASIAKRLCPIGISVGFWLSLLVAAALYGSVALAPRLLIWMRLRSDFYSNQVQLVELDRQVEYLEQVADALENDPDFATELARVDLGAARPGDERIPVDDNLSLAPNAAAPAAPRQVPADAWYMFLVETCATDHQVRLTLLGTAALTVVLAFGFLHERYESLLRCCGSALGHGLQHLLCRYRRSDGDSGSSADAA